MIRTDPPPVVDETMTASAFSDHTMCAPNQTEYVVAGDETLIAPNELPPNDPDWAWSQENTAVRLAEPAVVDRHVLGHGDLTTLAVNDHHIGWRYVWPITAVAAITAAVVIVMAVDPTAVRNLVQPPPPVVTTTTATATITAAPITETAPAATITLPPVTEAPAATVAAPSEDDQYLAAVSRTGWTVADDGEATANARRLCVMLTGPPAHTLSGMIAATPEIPRHIPPRVWYPLARDIYCPTQG